MEFPSSSRLRSHEGTALQMGGKELEVVGNGKPPLVPPVIPKKPDWCFKEFFSLCGILPDMIFSMKFSMPPTLNSHLVVG